MRSEGKAVPALGAVWRATMPKIQESTTTATKTTTIARISFRAVGDMSSPCGVVVVGPVDRID